MPTGNLFNKISFLTLSVLVAGISSRVSAQVSRYDSEKRGSVYLSIGTNSATHSASTINITQGTPGNISNYTLDKVAGDAQSTSKSSGLQQNIRLGYYFDYYQTFAIEISYDPVKYHVTDGQNVHLNGTLDNKTIDTSFSFSSANGYFYNIDGANLLAVNLVKRFQLFFAKSRIFRLDALAKVGGGPCMPHVYNSINGKVAEHPSFQFGGWNVGGEAALRATIYKYVFLEGGYRYSYASYSDLGVYNGTASQKLKTAQVVFSIGVALPTTKHNPLFAKAEDNKWKLCIKPIYSQPLDEGFDVSAPPEGGSKGKSSEPAAPAPSDAPAPAPPPEEPTPAPTPDVTR